MATGIGELEIIKEGKSNPRNFYELLKYMHHYYPIIFPQTYKSAEIVEGDGESVGSIKVWQYVLPGSPELLFCKERIDDIDDEKMFLALDVYQGNVRNRYKRFVFKVQVFPKGEGNLVKWTVEFEKVNPSMPDPQDYIDLYSVEHDKLDTYLVSKALNEV